MKEDPADEIQRVMKKERLSQADVQRRGFPADTLSRIRRGLVSPTWWTIQKIAEALGYVAEMRFRKKGNKDGD